MRRLVTILAALAVLLALPLIALAQSSGDEQKSVFLKFVQDRLSTPDRQISISNIDGALSSDATIREITVSDKQGPYLKLENIELNWNQAAIFIGRLEVNSLTAQSIEYLRNPIATPSGPSLPAPEATGISVPQLPVAVVIKKLAIPKITFGQQVFGLASQLSLNGNITLDGGSLDAGLAVKRLDGPGGALELAAKYDKGSTRLDLNLNVTEPKDGIIANLLNIAGRPDVALKVTGAGPIGKLQTQLTLDAGGTRALTGTATVKQQAEGFAIDAALDGPISTLVSPTYRSFFGSSSTLSAKALLRSEGGITINSLHLSGGQLNLAGSASTSKDWFLDDLHLHGEIADPAGGPVLLPVAGANTRIGGASLAVDLGGANQNWQGELAVRGFHDASLAADTLTLKGSGVAINLDVPTARRLTFNVDGALAGVTAQDPNVAKALGNSIGLGVAGLWNAGQPLQLAQFRLAGKSVAVDAAGTFDKSVFDGKLSVAASSLSPFSGIAGRPLAGALDLAARGSISPLTGGFDLDLDGTGTNLALGDATADRLLAGTVKLTGGIARTDKGLSARDFRLGDAEVQLAADGSFASDAADFRFDLALADLKLLSPQASGRLAITGTAQGQNRNIGLKLTANVPTGALLNRPLTKASVGFSGKLVEDALSGNLSGTANLDGHQVALASALSHADGLNKLSGLNFIAGGTSVTGDLTQRSDGLYEGRLNLASTNLSTAAELALLEASGTANATITLSANAGKQAASIAANVRGFKAAVATIGSADVKAEIADLFGRPQARFDLAGAGITAAAIKDFGVTPLSIKAGGTFADNAVQLASFAANSPGGLKLTAKGTVPLSAKNLDLVVEGSAPLALANRFVADRGGQASGTAQLSARITGSASDPRITGKVSVSAGSYVDPSLNMKLVDIGGSATLSGDAVTIDHLTANISTGGSISATGSVSLKAPAYAANLKLALNHVRYVDQSLLVATASGDLSLTGPAATAPLIGGTIRVEKADITVPSQLAGGAADIRVRHVDPPKPVAATLARARTEISSKPQSGKGPSGPKLDLKLTAPNQMFIRGRGLDVEMGGGLRLTGSLGDMRPVGGFQLVRGRLSILGQNVTFTSGTISLTGNLDPEIDLAANIPSDDITVDLTVSGRASDPKIEFTSSPTLPQDEVLSRLLFKQGVTQLSPIQLARLAAAAGELAGGSGSSLLDSLRSTTGLDDLDLTTDAQGNTAVQAGRYVTDNVYLGVQAGADGQSRATVNLDITRHLKANASSGSDGDSGVGVLYEQDY
ncbi:MAG TPA: translocation/assembly module TamB domain-containing protein [Devosiaceae bacterium]|nr:translocation/assembly module TamB domain-containing protein [Devosiaceae bacterium]